MPNIQDIFKAIATDGFSSSALQLIDNYTNDIQNGTTNFYRFTIPEHAGLCTAGSALIGASVVASYARASLTASRDASGSQGSPNSWEIDELQEQLIEKWAQAINVVNYAKKLFFRRMRRAYPMDKFVTTTLFQSIKIWVIANDQCILAVA